ncbi:MAG: ankyrin repeat domain-containing protein [Hydrogenophaga sp.]|nr:ankyrin repeat domain-containing protein [Hydrogenophaga sp.]
MSRDDLPPRPDDALLQRYREANALDAARPAPALRERVLAHARQAAATTEKPLRAPKTAANDGVWTWRALGGLAVVGLVGLLMLQFDRGSPEDKELAMGTGVSRPSAPPPEPTGQATLPVAPEASPPTDNAVTAAPAPTTDKQRAAPRTPEPAPARPAPPAPRVFGTAPDRPALAEAERAAEPPSIASAPAPGAARSPEAPAAAAPMPAPAPAPAAAPVAKSATADGMTRERRESGSVPVASPLMAAVTAGDPVAVRQVLEARADPNQRDGRGQTPLMEAARRGDIAIVRLLLAAGAERTLRDPQGLSAADHAERNGHATLLPLLR